MFKRSALIRIHVIIAAFFLSVGVMYLVTGGFYTWGVKGAYATETVEVTLASEMKPDLPALKAIVVTELGQRGLELPTGHAKIKKGGTSFYLEWTGSNLDVTFEPTGNAQVGKLKIKDTSFYRTFVQLHKAKGGTPFKVFAAIWAAGLLLLFITGFIIAMKTPMIRKSVLISAACGFVVFVILVVIG